MTDPLLLTSFLTIVGVWSISVISPGPDFMATAHTEAAVSRRDGSGGRVASGLPVAGRRAFRLGLLTDLSNPKAAAFFTSLFAVAVPPEAPLWFSALIIRSVVTLAGGWYALAACLVSLQPVARIHRRGQRAITGVTGLVVAVLGLRLALSER